MTYVENRSRLLLHLIQYYLSLTGWKRLFTITISSSTRLIYWLVHAYSPSLNINFFLFPKSVGKVVWILAKSTLINWLDNYIENTNSVHFQRFNKFHHFYWYLILVSLCLILCFPLGYSWNFRVCTFTIIVCAQATILIVGRLHMATYGKASERCKRSDAHHQGERARALKRNISANIFAVESGWVDCIFEVVKISLTHAWVTNRD